jgi:hypothetical protein
MNDKKRALQAPFPDKDIEWRAQMSGDKNGSYWALLLAYVTNRAIQERLDDVMGIENWKNEFLPAPDGGVMCGLSINFDDSWVTKYDGAENTAMEAVKGGLSGAMKRAAVQWGIGRYLYNLEATIVSLYDKKQNDDDLPITIKEGSTKKRMYCKRPKLPEWALPDDGSKSTPAPEQLEEIRILSAQTGKPANLTEVKIKTLLTYRQAEDYLKELRKRSSKEG